MNSERLAEISGDVATEIANCNSPSVGLTTEELEDRTDHSAEEIEEAMTTVERDDIVKTEGRWRANTPAYK